MVKIIDYYEYWNKNRNNKIIWHREKIALKCLNKLIKDKDKILDIGCGNGKFMEIISNTITDVFYLYSLSSAVVDLDYSFSNFRFGYIWI